MVRILLIQQLFSLSDEQMEFQLLDCLSFALLQIGSERSTPNPGRIYGIRTVIGVPSRVKRFKIAART
jgi:hypothetical protein